MAEVERYDAYHVYDAETRRTIRMSAEVIFKDRTTAVNFLHEATLAVGGTGHMGNRKKEKRWRAITAEASAQPGRRGSPTPAEDDDLPQAVDEENLARRHGGGASGVGARSCVSAVRSKSGL